MNGFIGFKTWADVVAHAQHKGGIYYHAPMDIYPSRVGVEVRGAKPRKVRVIPYADADPFWADAGHLARFMVRAAERMQA